MHKGKGFMVGAWLLAVLALPLDTRAICDVVPQPSYVNRGALGSLNRVFASPGERIEIALDAEGCDAGAPTFSSTSQPTQTISDFTDGLMDWTASCDGSCLWTQEAVGGNPGGWAHGEDWLFVFLPISDVISPPGFLGDWTARGVSELSWDRRVVDACGGTHVSPPLDVAIVSGPGGEARWRLTTPGEIGALPLGGAWAHFRAGSRRHAQRTRTTLRSVRSCGPATTASTTTRRPDRLGRRGLRRAGSAVPESGEEQGEEGLRPARRRALADPARHQAAGTPAADVARTFGRA